MAQSAEIRHEVGFLSTLPLGSIIAWHRDLIEQQVLSLPPGWVECNGQTLEDPESPFHGNVVPNLNLVDRDDELAGHEGGAFLRGAPRSGKLQQDQLQTHTHEDTGHQHPRNEEGRPERIVHTDDNVGHGHLSEGGDGNSNPVGELTGKGRAELGAPVGFGGVEVHQGTETRPVNMSVIWIMKVKQITAARALPAVLAHEDAPHGAVYVGADGNVGVGTGERVPGARLEVEGGGRLTGLEVLEALKVGGPLSAPSSLETFVDRGEKWDNTTDSPRYLPLVQREIVLVDRTNITAIGYGHGHTTSSPDLFITEELAQADGFSEYREIIMRMAEIDVALDVAIFIDGELFDPAPLDLDVGWGTAITHSKSWVPLVAIASTPLDPGEHTLELRYRARTGAAKVNFNGPMLVTMLLGVPGAQ